MHIVIKLENTDGQEENNYIIQGITIESILAYILPFFVVIVKILVHNMRSQYILNVQYSIIDDRYDILKQMSQT